MNIDLNIPPFLENRKQFSEDEVQSCRKIASLRIYVERAIGRIKKIPLTMARITNQIVFVCALLTKPPLVPLVEKYDEHNIDKYFEQFSDYDSMSES